MNGEHESRADRDPDNRSSEELTRLSRVEERLKQARPRAPSLDVETLERAALLGPARPEIDRVSKTATLRRRLRRDRPLYPRMAAIACSWACGVVVGAAAAFITLHQAAPPHGLADQTEAQTGRRPPGPNQQNSGHASDAETERGGRPLPATCPETPKAIADDAAVVAMIADPLCSSDSAYGWEEPTYHAGMHLRQYPGHSRGPAQPGLGAAGGHQPKSEPRRAEGPGRVAPDANPQPEITRKQLLRELLHETPASFL